MKQLLLRWGWLVLLLMVAIGATRLRFDAEPLDLLPEDVPAVQGLKIYQQHFANADELIITVQASAATEAEAAARSMSARLSSRTDLVKTIYWQPPWLEHPEQTTELVAYLWLNQPPQVMQELAARLSPTNLDAVLAGTRERLATTFSPQDLAQLSYDPLGFTQLPQSGMAGQWASGNQIFASSDGTFRILFVKAANPLPGYKECASWLSAVQKCVAGAGTAGCKIGYTGRPAFVAEISAGMKHDMTTSVAGTAVIIGILFWMAHRRLKPMLWLLTLLALILAATLAIGGLIFGVVSVISMGFAAILLGLAVDYAVVHYQEALAHPELSVPQIRRAIAPGIFWAAVTTISSFLVLNFGGLPGLAQLGSFVAIGVALAAVVMIFAYLPPLFPERMQTGAPTAGSHGSTSGASPSPQPSPAAGTMQFRIGSATVPVAFGRRLAGQPPSKISHHLVSPQEPEDFRRDAENSGRDDRAPKKQMNRSGAGRGRHGEEPRVFVFVLTGGLLLLCVFALASGVPRMDSSTHALEPRDCQAYVALDDIKKNIAGGRDPVWMVVTGANENEVARKLDMAQPLLERGVSNGVLSGFTSPAMLWPRPDNQAANREVVRRLLAERSQFHAAILSNGFSADALGTMDHVLDSWQSALSSPGVYWPSNSLCQWIFEKIAARGSNGLFAAAFLYPKGDPAALSSLQSSLSSDGVWLASWDMLGRTVLDSVRHHLWKLVVPIVVLILISLWLAFGRALEILLSLGVLLVSGLCLLAVMKMANWSWNVLNLMALPIVLGTGVDYSIFMQLALRRHHGNLGEARRSVGRALLLCGATAVAGFGSLGLSSNAGMAALGRVCAVGIAGNVLLAVLALPHWWKALARESAEPAAPSRFYQSWSWSVGLALGRHLPPAVCGALARFCASIYGTFSTRRREIVAQNLLPVTGNDKIAAARASKELFAQFGLKLADLWRYESGVPQEKWFVGWEGWEHFDKAHARGRGVLLVTPHLGNWEFGGAFLVEKGIRLLVLTQKEPDPRLTQMRQASRASKGVETLVVGEDAFAFVEIMKRLQGGTVVALLVDRPPPPTGVKVELFGRPFMASNAPAELARATGCAILPCMIIRRPDGYMARILPEIGYDRRAIGDRAARIRLTQEIMRVFEPAIRQDLTQWFHFVPIWPNDGV